MVQVPVDEGLSSQPCDAANFQMDLWLDIWSTQPTVDLPLPQGGPGQHQIQLLDPM